MANVPESFRGYVKICGVTSVDDALMVAESGASALGLIFAESPRQLTLAQAKEIAHASEGGLLRCAVFRHDEDDFILERVDAVGAEIVQLHGALRGRLLSELRTRPVRIVKALNIEDSEFDDFDETTVDAVMIDGAQPGSGRLHSWDRLRTRSFRVPVIAAGGLSPENVADIVLSTNVSGVDSASGVESSPGVKNPELVARFVLNARRALSSVEAT
ncbi:MAG TPA: phosphoribosylanthranilate isomerase [Acidimicrobiales bacterium]|nr:phosphoribosylanthranilate isomerase [Acidimicrobiales bacterium]